MCGLVTLFGSNSAERARSMLDTISHRGPDGSGLQVLRGGRTVLAHRRLAVIDPENGHQPLETENGGWALVANGMVYNDEWLRDRLGRWNYRTRSDCESILHTLVQRGLDGISDLDGMFAFVASDGERLVAGRDPLGIKPLYYARADGVLAFASEIKALLGFSERIEEFPPGHVYDSEIGFKAGRSLDAERMSLALPEASEALRHHLREAVRKQLRSDVPLGVFLSGGLDSSIIAALASKEIEKLHTFSVGFAGSDDLEAARQVAQHVGTCHHEFLLTPEIIDEHLPRILWHLESFDQGLVRSAVACYFVSKLSSQYVKVVLTGEGADELFAGYDYYASFHNVEALAEELLSSVGKMHNINLQRADRMSMAHGLEARVPFLDKNVVQFALGLPVDLKVGMSGKFIGKWNLRLAFEDMLPANIVWRSKAQFDQGSGVSAIMARAYGDGTSTIINPDPALGRTVEEMRYREILAAAFPTPNPLLELVAHWHPDYV